MAKELQKFEILLEKADNMFAPGDIVNGRVVVELNATKSIRGMKIIFMGRAEVKWSEPGGSEEDNSTCHLATEEYFRFEYYLLGGAGNTERVLIKSGNNAYPFNFCLPQKIPSSFEHFHGNVKYTIIAVMDKTSKHNVQAWMNLKVRTPCDLSQLAGSKLPIEDEGEDAFSCLPCFNVGTMTYSIYLPSTGYTAGEVLQASFIINNKSSVNVTKIKLQLTQNVKLRASGSTYKDTDMVEISELRGPFGKDDEILVGMIVPDLPPSNFPYCSIIDVQYFLHVDIVVSGCHCNVHRKYQILIGTDPTSNPELNQNSQTTSLPGQNPSSFLPVQQNVPAQFFGDNEPLTTTVTLPPEKSPDSGDPAPHLIASDESVTAGASTSMPDEPPPSYDDCMKFDV